MNFNIDISNMLEKTDIQIKKFGTSGPKKLFGFGMLVGGVSGIGIGYYIYKSNHDCDFTSSFDQIKNKQQGPIDGQMDHILKPFLILKNIKSHDNLYVKKLRYNAVALDCNQFDEYRKDRRGFYESKGFVTSDVEKYQTINYHLIDFNSKFLTRLLFKKSNIDLPSDYYSKITPIEQEYEKVLEKLIDQMEIKP